jgi:hypothetical protein
MRHDFDVVILKKTETHLQVKVVHNANVIIDFFANGTFIRSDDPSDIRRYSFDSDGHLVFLSERLESTWIEFDSYHPTSWAELLKSWLIDFVLLEKETNE